MSSEINCVAFHLLINFARFCKNTTVSENIWKVETFSMQGINFVGPKMSSAAQFINNKLWSEAGTTGQPDFVNKSFSTLNCFGILFKSPISIISPRDINCLALEMTGSAFCSVLQMFCCRLLHIFLLSKVVTG